MCKSLVKLVLPTTNCAFFSSVPWVAIFIGIGELAGMYKTYSVPLDGPSPILTTGSVFTGVLS